MIQTYSVAEISAYIREMFDLDYRLQDVTVTGEISNMTRASSGHWYFTLKDSQAQLKCVMWRMNAERQSFVPQHGDAVMARGHVSVYESRGEYQLYAESIRPVGVGDLYAEFERLKAKLEVEGLFDSERKRPLPYFPVRIGIVTSPSAAAFQDVQNVLRRRFPLAQVILSPTAVQGDSAPPQIVAALERLNMRVDVDVILMVRGGGSIEDLWAFNDETVARAVAASRIPVVAGVGHESDFTIVDFVADLRAPTPSAAAEQSTPDVADLRLGLTSLDAVMTNLVKGRIGDLSDDLLAAQRSLGHLSPAREIATLRQRIDDWGLRLERSQKSRFGTLRERLQSRTAALHAANPQAILQRGYAIVTYSDSGERVKNAADAQVGDGIIVQLHDGDLTARVENKKTHEQYQRTLF